MKTMDGSNLDRPRHRRVQDETASTPLEDPSDSDDEDGLSEESERSLKDYPKAFGTVHQKTSQDIHQGQLMGASYLDRSPRYEQFASQGETREASLAQSAFAMCAQSNGTKTKRRRRRNRRRGRRRRKRGRGKRRGGRGRRRGRRRRRRRRRGRRGGKGRRRKERGVEILGGREGGEGERERRKRKRRRGRRSPGSKGSKYKPVKRKRPSEDQSTDMTDDASVGEDYDEDSDWSPHYYVGGYRSERFDPDPLFEGPTESDLSKTTFYGQGPEPTLLCYGMVIPSSAAYKPSQREFVLEESHSTGSTFLSGQGPDSITSAGKACGAVSYTTNRPFSREYTGALPKDTSKKITVEVLRDVPTNIVLTDEMIVTRAFQCHPSGLYFQVGKPVRLRIVHCADLIDPQKVQTVLFSWSHVSEDGIATGYLERIVQTSRSCWVTPNFIEISLEHFSGGILAFIWNWWYMNGKLMSFMPFLPRAMPSTRRVMMELRMVNKPHETYWKNVHVVDKNGLYHAAKDDDDVMIVKQEDLQVELQLEEDSLISKRVSSENLRKTKHTLYFNMDLSNKSDESLVVLNLEQSSGQMDIQFMTHFSEHVEFESSSSGKDEIEGSFVRRPSDSASDNNVSESELEMLVGDLGDHEDVRGLALKLGFKYVNWQAFRKMNKDRGFDGTRGMLFDWKKKTPKQEQRSTLRKALEESGFGEAAESL